MASPFSRRLFLLQLAGALAAGACGGNDDADGALPDPGKGSRTDADAGHEGDGGQDADGVDAQDAAPVDTSVPGVDLDAIPYQGADFPYRVMAGDATATNAMVWTRYTGTGTLHVQLELEKGANGRAVISREVAASEIGDGGFVHVDVAGLAAGQRYRYTFFVVEGGKPVSRSAFGAVRAALAPGALETITFAGTSCTHQLSVPFPLMTDASKRKLDFFIHAGDHVYADYQTGAFTLADFRSKYADAWHASGLQALHASTGMVMTWDDHEFANNWNPETFPASRRDAAMAAYFEHRATRRDASAPNRVWKSLVWGDTLEVLVLDCRSERKPSTRTTANAQFLSPAQMAWLKDRLSRSTAVFKLVVASVPISHFPPDMHPGYDPTDKWEGYAAPRDEILDFIATKAIKGVWWLAGDLHFGSVGTVEATGPRKQMHEVLMGPTGSPPVSPVLPSTQFDAVVNEKNYTLFHADPVKRELTIEVIGENGSLFKRVYPA